MLRLRDVCLGLDLWPWAWDGLCDRLVQTERFGVRFGAIVAVVAGAQVKAFHI